MNPVGQIVKKKRELSGLSQNKLAKKAGISQASLNALESKTNNPSVETLYLLAAAFDCSVSELLGEELPGEIRLTSRQKQLLSLFDQLNDAGKDFLLNLANTVLENSDYRQEGSISSIV